MLKCRFGPNLEMLTSIGDEWTREQTQNRVNFNFKLNLALEVKANQLQKYMF